MQYALIDSGSQKKFERFGSYTLVRPCSQALWAPAKPKWEADATFSREGKKGWSGPKKLPVSWICEHKGLKFKISPTDFGHLGLFPEHGTLWQWMEALIASKRKAPEILNLFAYSGGASLACARAGASVTHVDASKGMVDWAKENAKLNSLNIRWIVDDAMKFLSREMRRGRRYNGIILDPPSFGRGSRGEVFKIEEEIRPLLALCKQVLSDSPLFFVFTCHTPGITPVVMENLLAEILPGKIEKGELAIDYLPLGTYARWCP